MLQLLSDPGVHGASTSRAPPGGDRAGSDGLALVNVELGLGGGGGGGGGGRGNRWSREETLALLQIRSDMDGAFRHFGYKGLAWEEVSRKMAEKGFYRSWRKCREKFDNVYKYHRRAKEVQSSEGKSVAEPYRFFDQLEALHPTLADPIALAVPPPAPRQPLAITPPPGFTNSQLNWRRAPLRRTEFTTPTLSSSSSSSSSSSEEIVRKRSSRKRKWKDLFVKLTEDVMKKQDDIEKKLMDKIDRREQERRIREETWKAHEMTRLNQICDILNKEHAVASAKEVALIYRLQKLSDDQRIPPLPPSIFQPQPPILTPPAPTPTPTPAPTPTPTPTPTPNPNPTLTPTSAAAAETRDKGPVRWPKEEVDALIKARAKMDDKHHHQLEERAKWVEISGAMKTMGFNRSAKRCSQKWDNMTRYYKRVKRTNKKPRADSKTCYYYQLEELYTGASTSKAPAADQDGEDGDSDEDDDEEEEGYEISSRATAAMEGLLID